MQCTLRWPPFVSLVEDAFVCAYMQLATKDDPGGNVVEVLRVELLSIVPRSSKVDECKLPLYTKGHGSWLPGGPWLFRQSRQRSCLTP